MTGTAKQLIIVFFAVCSSALCAAEFTDTVEHKFADNDGVKIHYAKAGGGPLAVFIHGFPDFWYSWRHQMEGLASDFTVAAMDTRGYNKSDQPVGVENYDMSLLIDDVAAIIANEGRDSAVIIGHDSPGLENDDTAGGIAWSFAAARPDLTSHLIVLNLPHLKNLARELAKMDQQHRNSEYARNFQSPTSHENISAERLASSLSRGDKSLHAIYLEAFENSSADAMMNYYRANFPREPYTSGVFAEIDRIQMPVLQFHGLNDTALLAESLNNTWDELDQDWTLVTIPGAGHWPHHDKPEKVTNMMKAWLQLQTE